jgi:DNA-binding response OmpR family regulator
MLLKENIINALKETNKNGFMLNEIISIINEVTNQYVSPNIESEGIFLNPTGCEVVVGEKKKKLPNKEFNLLYYLISNKNKCIQRHEILRDVWGTDVFVLDRTIDVHIRKLRVVVGNDNLRTIKCVGYGWFETK